MSGSSGLTTLWLRSLHACLQPDGDPRRFGRLLLVVFAAVVIGSVLAAHLVSNRRPVGDPGVHLTVVAFGASTVGGLLACMGELSVGIRSSFSRWLAVLPVSRRRQELVGRAPVVTTLLLAGILVGPACHAYVRTVTTQGMAGTVAAVCSVLLVGPSTAPLLVLASQVASNRFAIAQYFAGVLTAAWCGWVALNGFVFRRMLEIGVEGGVGVREALLVWPGVVRFLLTDELSSLLVSFIGLAGFALMSAAVIGRLQPATDLADQVLVERVGGFRRRPLVQLLWTRSWRNRRTRGYLVAGAASTGVSAAVTSQQGGATATAELGALLVALFVAGFVTVGRGLAGRTPLERQLFPVPAGRWTGAWFLSGPGAAALLGLIALGALGAVAGSGELVSRGAALVVVAAAVGSAVGSRRVPPPGDASAEVVASGLFLLTVMTAGHAADSLWPESWSGHLLLLCSLAAIYLLDAALTEARRARRPLVSSAGDSS